LNEQKVTYSLYKDGEFYLVENVPARVDQETGEQFFSPSTVEKIQKIVLGHPKPLRMINTLVFEFSCFFLIPLPFLGSCVGGKIWIYMNHY
jgi:hypothetical protein